MNLYKNNILMWIKIKKKKIKFELINNKNEL